MDNNDLKNIFEKCLKRGESECIEFKVDNFDKIKIGQRLSAISNSATINGKNFGYLIFGVNDQGRVVGTNFKPKKQKIGNEELEFWLNQMISPKINFKIYLLDFQALFTIQRDKNN
jgi:predicted HTH transcriptional regulator